MTSQALGVHYMYHCISPLNSVFFLFDKTYVYLYMYRNGSHGSGSGGVLQTDKRAVRREKDQPGEV